jgi:hypothetical protein
MTRILVNNEPRPVESGLKTWGELLAWADRTCAGTGELVTAVRLDGVDEPSFRDPGVAERPLEHMAVVELDIASPAVLVGESLREALNGLDGLRRHTLDVARRFRSTQVAHANEGLAELTLGLRTLVALVETVGGAMGVALSTVTWEGRPVIQLLEDLANPLVSLSEAQTGHDWVTVADVLEFDLEPALGQCGPFFEALASLARRVATPTTH